MHFAIPLAVSALLVAPAQAQTRPPPEPAIQTAQAPGPAIATAAPPAAAPATAAPATAATAPAAAAPATARPPYRRQTLLQRFDEANAPKDGHLTLDQANAIHWTYITRNFAAMDKAHKGYVTVEDIRAFARERRAARQTQPGAARARG